MANLIDTVSIYMILRKLVTPFIQMPAFHAGVIDENGNFLVSRQEMTPAQANACSLLDVLVINLKKLLGKLPGGRTQLASFAAALLLIRQNKVVTEENVINILFTLEEDYKLTFNQLKEDAPAMSVSGGHVAGIGAKDPFDVGISKKAQKKYREKANIFRRKPVVESTLQYHEQLNPKIWDNMVLMPEIRGKLLQIAETWRQFAKIPTELIKDIIITGGNCNYNYTDQSDIDLHLVIDRNLINQDRAFVDDYLQDKKILWTMTHPDINIKGYPVELYAQDLDEQPHSGQGVYSILDNNWIQAPQYLGINFENDFHLRKKVAFYASMIDKMIAQKADKDTMDQIKKKIRTMRGDSIAQGGEFAFGNLVFKELRNMGYLDKMDDYEKSMQDKALSLENLNVQFTKSFRSI